MLRTVLKRSASRGPTTRFFHGTPRAFVKVGDAIPPVDLMEGSPGNKVNLAAEFKKSGGKGVVIGVPAAFSQFLELC